MSSIGNISAYSYEGIASAGGAGKLYVPVSKSALLYSHFDHVSGVAARSGQNGVSISKIRILNSLIERLSAIKNEPASTINEISDERADALIKNYQQQLQAAMQTPYLLAGATPQVGELFSILA